MFSRVISGVCRMTSEEYITVLRSTEVCNYKRLLYNFNLHVLSPSIIMDHLNIPDVAVLYIMNILVDFLGPQALETKKSSQILQNLEVISRITKLEKKNV